MLKERIKSSVIFILIINLIFLTSHLWFFSQNHLVGDEIARHARNIPVIGHLFPKGKTEYSISKENLSRPRKFLINDGSLWMVYYNTDIGFSPIESRTRKIISGFLNGDITATKKIDYRTWESGLESMSIYVEYPVGFSIEMFGRIMGADVTKLPKEIKSLRELVILPSSDDTNMCILVRDASDESSIYAFILDSSYSLPASDLAVYTSSDGYYEPVFSTGLELVSENISLSPLVLFSDSQPTTEVLYANNLLNEKSRIGLLETFSFNSIVASPYQDTEGAFNYIANYGSAKIYPDSVFEYTAIEEDKGILLDESGNAYNVLNASIDFAEKVWSTMSSQQLSILVASDLSDYDADEPYTFKFDYYVSGRPVEVSLPESYGHPEMQCAIEMTVSNGKLISYRQYMRSYSVASYYNMPDTFVTALDSFVQTIDNETVSPTVIEDIYIGYLDSGYADEIYASWLARTSDGNIYRYVPKTEVNSLELE